jgi:hypothetical protein
MGETIHWMATTEGTPPPAPVVGTGRLPQRYQPASDAEARTLSASAVNLESFAGFQPPRMLVTFVNITEVTKHSLVPPAYRY